ncbi:ABC transporter substrate-binding protein [Ectopseudomonas mendocina]|uniref:ABC transporter substrate-binding protein n=1 Tax=Ectopseudomonas mendocina TaxID=300 RepID=A0ABZ2RLR2_ECTME
MRLLTLLFIALLSPALHAVPQRVVSLDLCMDWLLAYYAAPERITALSPLNKRYPVEWIGTDWPSHDGSLEQVYALKPDKVLVGQYAAQLLRKRLVELGVDVEVLPLPQTLEQVTAYEQQFLKALDLPLSLADQPPTALTAPAHPKRLLLLGANGIGTGRMTLEDEILQRAGWTNYLTAEGYQRLDLEQVAQDPPDAILWAAPEHRALANQFAEHTALQQAVPAGRWLTTDYWRWQCPGPWTWELIGQLHQWLD